MEHSREYITSVVVGKDVVPRIGLHQLEALRHDLIHALHRSKEPKVSGSAYVLLLHCARVMKV